MATTLLTTAQAAREVGMSSRTLSRYAVGGVLTPATVLPSGHRRWDLADLRRQLDVLAVRRESSEPDPEPPFSPELRAERPPHLDGGDEAS